MKKLTLEDAARIATEFGGECISTSYANNYEDLQWKCDRGHDFKKPLKRVKKGEWCPICSGKYVIFSPKELNDHAGKFGGKCLADSTKKISEYVTWECSDGHQWKAQIANVITNESWCPTCKSHIGEEVCRHIFQIFTGQSFQKARPIWLRDSGSKSLELDGYCEHLKIAFEHQGRQHYGHKTSLFGGKDVLMRDALKRRLCHEQGISLLEIPELGAMSSLEDVIQIIKRFLVENDVPVLRELTVDELSSKMPSLYKAHINHLNDIAHSKGGKCLSSQYLGHITPLEFECQKGHRWFARPNDIKRGSWCSICSRAGGKKKTLEYLNEMAAPYEIRCLSAVYTNSKSTYEWLCSKGHRFECRYDYLKSAKGCPVCAKSHTNGFD